MKSIEVVTEQPKLMNSNMIVKKIKKKRKYSSTFKELQKMERGVSKALKRLADAVDSGISTYHEETNKSSYRKRDGAILDFPLNLTQGLGVTISKVSLAPYDIAKTLNTKALKSGLRVIDQLLIGE